MKQPLQIFKSGFIFQTVFNYLKLLQILVLGILYSRDLIQNSGIAELSIIRNFSSTFIILLVVYKYMDS